MAQNNRIYRSPEASNTGFQPYYAQVDDTLLSPSKIDVFASRTPLSANLAYLLT